MKRPWTRDEKRLWATPILFGLLVLATTWGPDVARETMGIPLLLDTTPTNQLYSVVLSRDGSVLAAVGRDDAKRISPSSGTVYLWDARTLRPLKSFAPKNWNNASILNGYIAESLSLSPDGKLRGIRVQGASSHAIQEVVSKRIWHSYNAPKWKTPPTIAGGYVFESLSLSPDGKLMGIRGRGASGYGVHDVATQKLLWNTTTYIQNAEFSADGRFVALGHLDLRNGRTGFELREAETGQVVTRWLAQNGSGIGHFSLSPDAKTVAWIGDCENAKTVNDKVVEIRRLKDGKLLRILPQSEHSEAVTFSPDGSRIVSVAIEQLSSKTIPTSIVRCHSKTGALLWRRDFRNWPEENVGACYFCDAVFSPDGKSIALRDGTTENYSLILDASTGSDKKQLVAAQGQSTSGLASHALAFSPDGNRLFARGKDAVLVWTVR